MSDCFIKFEILLSLGTKYFDATRTMSKPFPPSEGMGLTFKRDDRFYYVTPRGVTWDTATQLHDVFSCQYFRCKISCLDSDYIPGTGNSIEEQVAAYKERGWTLIERK